MGCLKRTARKSTGGKIPLHSPLKKKPRVELKVHVSKGEATGEAVFHLKDMLEQAGTEGNIDFHFVSQELKSPDNVEWKSELKIMVDGTMLRSYHSPTWRDSRVRAEEDAVWHAITSQADILDRNLDNTDYQLITRRPSGTIHYRNGSFAAPIHTHQVTKGLCFGTKAFWRASKMQEEMHDLRKQLKKSQARVRKLERMEKGEASNLVTSNDEEVQLPISPDRLAIKPAKIEATPAAVPPAESQASVNKEEKEEEEPTMEEKFD